MGIHGLGSVSIRGSEVQPAMYRGRWELRRRDVRLSRTARSVKHGEDLGGR